MSAKIATIMPKITGTQPKIIKTAVAVKIPYQREKNPKHRNKPKIVLKNRLSGLVRWQWLRL